MVMAVGCSSAGSTPGAAMFHLTTHAFFKALLFLGAGSVLVSLHHEQDIWKMGGLWRKMPVTSITFGIGALALAGCPGFSGFFSKEEILMLASERQPALFWVGLFVSFLTSFYIGRLCFVAFLGKSRSKLVHHVHESHKIILIPLLILAAFSLGGGYLNLQTYFQLPIAHGEMGRMTMFLSICAFCLGTGASWIFYGSAETEKFNIKLLAEKFYFDEFYDRVLVRFQQAIARIAAWFDNWILGGFLVRGSAVVASCTGEILRLFQAGSLQVYTYLFCLGSALVIYFTLMR